MANISGRVVFDKNRSGSIDAGDSGLANVPVVLQNTATGLRVVVLTDVSGNYSFTNVTNGNYRIVEAYGTGGGVPTPGDFNAAVAGSVPVGEDPPISFASSPPVGSTNLDSITPNTLLVTVSGVDLTSQNFLDGPIIYKPISVILDSCTTVLPANIITVADNGTFGSFLAGTAVNTTATGTAINPPYPGVTPGFTYVMSIGPSDGQYTIQNIREGSGVWWRIADHTKGDETGRFMLINGANPGAVFFQQTVTVTANTEYLFSSWILNLIRLPGYADPSLGVEILDQNNNIIYSQTLGNLIPANFNVPEWKEIGTVINSQNNTQLTVKFVSQGPAAAGNDYTIDDIFLQEIQVPNFIPVKSIDKQYAVIGDIVTYTVTLTNTCNKPLTNVFFKDTIPSELTFVGGSVIVNGGPDFFADPNVGFTVPDIPGGGTDTIIFKVQVNNTAVTGTTINNMAVMSYYYTPIDGGISNLYTQNSNIVPLKITERDYGDAPDTSAGNGPNNYSTLLANNGPRHILSNNVKFGQFVTGETNAYQNPTAIGDDLSKSIQDDGPISIVPPIIVGDSTYTLPLKYFNDSGNPAIIYGWVDFNRNGIFQINESTGLNVVPSDTVNPRDINLMFNIPNGTIFTPGDTTFIRIRITTSLLPEANILPSDEDSKSLGEALDGEVEDYIVNIVELNVEGTVWYDTNCNGIREIGEPVAQNIVVKLYNINNEDNPAYIMTTDVNGKYAFNNLPSGKYYVQVTLPNGYTFTIPNAGIDDTVDSDIIPSLRKSVQFDLNGTNTNQVIDAGFCKLNKISGQAFYDCDFNGIYGDEDKPLCGVRITLYNSTGIKVGDQITDCDGYYEFRNLKSGIYVVQVSPVVGLSIVAPVLTEYYGSKADNTTGLFTINLSNSDYLQGFVGFSGALNNRCGSC